MYIYMYMYMCVGICTYTWATVYMYDGDVYVAQNRVHVKVH